jgi:hypothetical protein
MFIRPKMPALFGGAQLRDGEAAAHCAAMLLFVRGKADDPFDRERHPFLPRFRAEDHFGREAAFAEPSGKAGVDPSTYLERT